MNKFLIVLSIIIALGCGRPETKVDKSHAYYNIDTVHSDYLISYSDDNEFSYPASCGYKNLHGEIVIPKGKYSHCHTDTFRHFAIVFDEKQTNSEIVAIDRKERILFDVYMFDNFPDESSEGLFRVKRNGKIGYANDYGQIVIPCKFQCADTFEDGRAKVAFSCKEFDGDDHKAPESDEWFYIDKSGNRVK